MNPELIWVAKPVDEVVKIHMNVRDIEVGLASNVNVFHHMEVVVEVWLIISLE